MSSIAFCAPPHHLPVYASPHDDRPLAPEQDLAVAVLRQAWKDLHDRANPLLQADARAFWTGPAVWDWCEVLDLPTSVVQRHIEAALTQQASWARQLMLFPEVP